jgi:hypothetical protein
MLLSDLLKGDTMDEADRKHQQELREKYEARKKEQYKNEWMKRKDAPAYHERMRQWREKNRDKINAKKRAIRSTELGKEQMRKYNIQGAGLTVEQYDATCAKQENKCAICGVEYTKTKSGRVKRLSIDHHHKTMVFRGLLCHKCNTAVGLMCDDPVIALAAANYLRERNVITETSFIIGKTKNKSGPWR